MSYPASYPVYQTHGTNSHRLREFVPTYQVRSDYLPGAVREGNNPQVNDLLRRYEEERRRGRVFTQRPVEFNPNRYVSFLTNEHVATERVISHDEFTRLSRRAY